MKKMNPVLFVAILLLIVLGFTACGKKTNRKIQNKNVEKMEGGVRKESKILKKLTNKATNAMENNNQKIQRELDD